MILLRDMQFEILPTEDSNVDGYAFGIGRDVSINDGGFTPAERTWMTQDGANQTRGTTMFGRDIQTAGSWAWSGHTDQDDDREALAAAGAFGAAWMPPNGTHWEPGEVTTLRYRLGGRVRRIYGRPRRFAAPLSNLMIGGNIPVNADFVLADPRHYSDEVHRVQMSWTGMPTSGIKMPTRLPLRTLPQGQREGSLVVGGDAPTYPIIRFYGPVTKPSLVGEDFELVLNTTVAASSWVDIDTRPWHMTVLRSDGASLAGKLGRRQWLEDVRLRPGPHQLAFRGSAAGGTATCEVRWRDAWSNI